MKEEKPRLVAVPGELSNESTVGVIKALVLRLIDERVFLICGRCEVDLPKERSGESAGGLGRILLSCHLEDVKASVSG